MRWLVRNLFRRLLISFLITVVLGLGVMGTIIWILTKNHIYLTQQEEMLRQAKRVNLAIQDHDDHNGEGITENTQQTLEFLDQSFNANIWLFDKNGKIVTTSTRDEVYVGREISADIVQKTLQGQDVLQNLTIEGLNRPMMSAIVPWGEGDQIYGGIVLIASVEGLNAAAQQMRETVLWAMLFGVLISTAMVSYISWSLSRPLNQIKQATSEISLGNYSKRVSTDYELDELGELGQAFNRMAEKLEQVETERQTQDQRRDHFLTSISHELRTPLTAMQGFLEALQDGLVRDESSRQRYYQVMYQEAMYLNRLVDDLMDLMKLEKGEVTLDAHLVRLEEIAEKVAFTLESAIKEKGNQIEVDYPPDLPLLSADSLRLEQIFVNLIHNANKFTENGTIRIHISADEQNMKITVSDTGIGIPSHDLPKIWERFFKVNRGRSKKEGGTGLGLAIVKELVELHQGDIRVESELGKGTTFAISLPLGQQLKRS